MKRTTVLLACVVAGCATTAKDAHMRDETAVIAHRGASAYAPENTMAAFRLADEMAADWFELDCTLSRDGEVVVIHDGTVDRTTDGTGAVGDLALADLKRLDAGSWKEPKFAGERLPTLGEALDFAKGRIGVYIEIKDSDDDGALGQRILELAGDRSALSPKLRREAMKLVEADGTRNLALTREVVELVRERRMGRQVVVQSFSPIVCLVAMSEAPKLRVELLGVDDREKPQVWENFLRWGYLLDVAGFNPNLESLTPGRLAAFRAAGKSVSVWTVDKPDDMRRLADWGVDGIITNRPDECRRVLQGTR